VPTKEKRGIGLRGATEAFHECGMLLTDGLRQHRVLFRLEERKGTRRPYRRAPGI